MARFTKTGARRAAVERMPSWGDMSRTIWTLGDLHFGAINSTRLNAVMADLLACPDPLAYLQVGDLTQNGTAPQDATAQAWLTQLTAPCHVMPGNHDVEGDNRSMAAWETAWGVARNRVVDLGFGKIVIASPDAEALAWSTATIDWVAAQLDGSGPDCMVATHCPLEGTHLDSPSEPQYTSLEAFFSLDPNPEILNVLDMRPRAKLFDSGHTHSPRDTVDLIKLHDVGSRNILCLNAGALYYTGRNIEQATDPLDSLLIEWLDDRVNVRLRDHWTGRLTNRPGQPKVETWGLPS